MPQKFTRATLHVELKQTFIDVEHSDGAETTIEVGKAQKTHFLEHKTGRELSPEQMLSGLLDKLDRPMNEYISKETAAQALGSGRAVAVQAFPMSVAPGALSLSVDDRLSVVTNLNFRLLLSVAPSRM